MSLIQQQEVSAIRVSSEWLGQSSAERLKNERSRNHLYNQPYCSTETEWRRQTPFSLVISSCNSTRWLTGISHLVSTHTEPCIHGIQLPWRDCKVGFWDSSLSVRIWRITTVLRSTRQDYTMTVVLAEKKCIKI